MATTMQFWDETNSIVLFDLNDSTGANASDTGYSQTYLGGNLDLGSPAFEFERFNPPQRDGGSTTFQRAGLRQLSIPLMIVASTYDNYAKAVGRLAQLCYTGGVLKFLPDGSANTRFIDVEPSPTPFYLDGRAVSLYEAVRLFGRGTGITLSLTAQPYFRGSELDSATNLFTNATLLRDADLGGRADGWSWSSTSNITNEAISATSEAFQFDIATAAQRSLTQSTGAATAAVGEVWTLSGEARVTATSATTFMEPMLTWRTSAPADISTITGTLTNLTTAWQRISVSGTAPATTDRIQAGPRMDNSAATSATVQFRNWQIEKAAAATPFRVGSETATVDPSPSSGMGRVLPFWNPGDAPCPVTVVAQNTTSSHADEIVAIASNKGGPVGSQNLTTLLNGGLVSQCEAWTVGTDTATDTNANSSPGSSNTGLLTTFVTTTLTQRGFVSGLNAAAHRGRTYRAFLRFTARTAVYNGVINLRWTYPPIPNTDNSSVTVTSAAVGTYYEADMGLVTCPDVSSSGLGLSIFASRTSGTGNLVLDYVLLVPVDEQAGTIIMSGSVTNTNQLRTYPEDSAWFGTTTAGVGASFQVLSINGPVPFIAQPGLNLVQLSLEASLTGVTSNSGDYQSLARTDATAHRFIFEPRYLT